MGDISKIKVGNTWHTVKDAAARAQNAAHHTYYVKGTQIASTGSWTGNLPDVDALYEGLSIDYWLPYSGSGNATLELTLKDGSTTGPVPVYIGAASRLTTHQAINTVWRYIYQTVTISNVEYTGWWAVRSLDNNTTDITNLYNGSVNYTADSVIYRYQLLFPVDADTLTPLNNASNVTAATKTMLTGVDFDPFGPIFYLNSSGTVNAGASIAGTALYYHRNTVDLRYTFNCAQTLTAYKAVYVKVVPQSNGKVRLASDPCWAQELPAADDGYWYIFLGRTQDTYRFALYTDHPVYAWRNGGWTEITNAEPVNGSSGGGGTWGSITGAMSNQTDLQDALDGKANASHTHGGIEIRPDYVISSVDLTDGVSELESGKLYFYYEV